MKRFEHLGRSLSKQEQKTVKGGYVEPGGGGGGWCGTPGTVMGCPRGFIPPDPTVGGCGHRLDGERYTGICIDTTNGNCYGIGMAECRRTYS